MDQDAEFANASAAAGAVVHPADNSILAADHRKQIAQIVDEAASAVGSTYLAIDLSHQVMSYQPDLANLSPEYRNTVEHWKLIQTKCKAAIKYSQNVRGWLIKITTGLETVATLTTDMRQMGVKLAESKDDPVAYEQTLSSFIISLKHLQEVQKEIVTLCDQKMEGGNSIKELIAANDISTLSDLLGPAGSNLKMQYELLHDLQKKVTNVRQELFKLYTDLHNGAETDLMHAEIQLKESRVLLVMYEQKQATLAKQLATIRESIDRANAQSDQAREEVQRRHKVLAEQADHRLHEANAQLAAQLSQVDAQRVELGQKHQSNIDALNAELLSIK